MEKFLKVVGAGLIGVFLIVICGLLTGVLVMWLWNWLIPTIFGLNKITYLQGWGLSVLTGLLFRGNIKIEDKSK